MRKRDIRASRQAKQRQREQELQAQTRSNEQPEARALVEQQLLPGMSMNKTCE